MSVWGELKRRNVVKVGLAYLVVAWLLIQVAATVLPTFDAPGWVTPSFTFLLILGLPVVLVIAWAFEITPEGLKPTAQVAREDSITHATGQKLNYLVTGLLVLAVAFMAVDNYLLDDRTAEPPGESQAATPAASQPPPAQAAEPAALPNSVAVIPFNNMSPNENDAYFAAGIHEEILNQLVRLSDLNVIARTSVMQYAGTQRPIPEIARELNVETVMEGSVRYAEGEVLVTVQLIDAATNLHLWSESYRRPFANIFEIQTNIATNVANALAAEFTPAEQASMSRRPTESLEAYDLFLAAQDLNLSANITAALEKVDEALAIDPAFARAWALKADLHGSLSQASAGDAFVVQRQAGRDAARRAAELEPESIEARAVLAADRSFSGAWAEAEALFRGQSETSSGLMALWHGVHLLSVGDIEQANEVLDVARRVDPLNQITRGFHLLGLALGGDVAQAEEEYTRGTAVFGGAWFGDWYISMARLEVGNATDQIPEFFLPVDPSGPAIHNEMRQYLGSAERGRERLREIHAAGELGSGALLATGVWAGHFGDSELAFDAIAEATMLNGQNVLHFWLPALRDVRQTPRFEAFVREIGLVDYWNEFGWRAFCRPVGGDDFVCS